MVCLRRISFFFLCWVLLWGTAGKASAQSGATASPQQSGVTESPQQVDALQQQLTELQKQMDQVQAELKRLSATNNAASTSNAKPALPNSDVVVGEEEQTKTSVANRLNEGT